MLHFRHPGARPAYGCRFCSNGLLRKEPLLRFRHPATVFLSWMSFLQQRFASAGTSAAFPTTRHQIPARMSDLQHPFALQGTVTAFPTSSKAKSILCRRFGAYSNLCRSFAGKPRHRFDFRKPDLRFCWGNPIYVDVFDQNLDTGLISSELTCGFTGELDFLLTFAGSNPVRVNVLPADLDKGLISPELACGLLEEANSLLMF